MESREDYPSQGVWHRREDQHPGCKGLPPASLGHLYHLCGLLRDCLPFHRPSNVSNLGRSGESGTLSWVLLFTLHAGCVLQTTVPCTFTKCVMFLHYISDEKIKTIRAGVHLYIYIYVCI